MKKIGYLRVSTSEQLLDRQINSLRPVCDALYIETLSAVSKRRPFYEKALRRLRSGDVLVVLDTDRAYRNATEALVEIDRLKAKNIGFRVLNFPTDTTTPEGHFALTVKLAADQLEREVLIRRTKEGIAAARARGVRLGRPRKLSSAQIDFARAELRGDLRTVEQVAKQMHVTRWTLSRALARAESQ
jgi:DNA invertase Pin-like site-specific DNA recombinase